MTAILKWDPNQDVANLRLYERAAGDLRMKVQSPPGKINLRHALKESEANDDARYWDERW